MSVEYAIIIKNKTRLETLIERFNTKAQAKFYIERSGGDFNDYEKEHEIFHNSLSRVQRDLSTVLKNKIVERSFLPSISSISSMGKTPSDCHRQREQCLPAVWH